MRKLGWRVAQAVVGALILYLLGRHLLGDWHKAQQQSINWEFHWGFIVASLVVTWAMYGVLIWGWRAIILGWRERLDGIDAARIWSISNMGKYIPFKIWSIAGMGLMAQRRGVSGPAAMGSAIVMQLISIATGAVIGIALAGTAVLDQAFGEWAGLAAIGLAMLALLTAVALASSSVTSRIAFLLRRPEGIRPVEPGALAAGLVANLAAWCGYGLALMLLARGTVHDAGLSWIDATGAFAAAYIVGYLALFLPGGVGVREFVQIALLKDVMGLGPAAALAVASRLALTANDVGAALFFLPFRSKTRDLSRAT